MPDDPTLSLEQSDGSTITARKCLDDDWPRAIEILKAVYVGEGYVSPERAALAYRRETLAPAGTVLVATDQHSVFGAVVLLHQGSPLAQVAGDGEAEFRLLAVDPSARGRGVGEVLVRACIQLAAIPPLAAKSLVLWTRPQMIAAQRLYVRLGFRRTPHRDALLEPLPPASPPLERWVYCRSLDG